MLLKAIFVLLTQTFGIITATVFPALPPTLEIYFGYLVNYINQGMSFIAIFIDIPYVSQLFSWWIALGATILAIELFMWIWNVVTGNFHGEYNAETTTITKWENEEGYHGTTKTTRSTNGSYEKQKNIVKKIFRR